MSIEDKANRVVDYAKTLSSNASSWAEFSNKLFDQETGFIAKTFGRMTERLAFYEMPQNAEVDRIFLEVVKRHGVAQGASQKSGKFVVRVPKTLHAALEVQASDEGVSLNQLAVTKLAIDLNKSTDLFTARILEAFRASHRGYSSDRVIIDDSLNAGFLKECRALGLNQSDFALNHRLFNIRKSGKGLLPPTTNRPVINDYDKFEFASEIAFRFLQRKDGVSLDDVLCDPTLRSKFDEIAQRLVKESILRLRAGALNLRKSHKLKPTDAQSEWYTLQSVCHISQVRLSDLPTDPAAYVFYDEGDRPLFAGETANLRERVGRHLEASQNVGLPMWLEDKPHKSIDLRFTALPSVTQTNRLSWLRNFINREKPLLNYQREAA